MCLPPKDNNTKEYFIKMKNLAQKINVKELSMGMSNDYLDAAKHGATYLRIGSKVFGNRNQPIFILVFLLINFSKISKSFFFNAIQPAVGL